MPVKPPVYSRVFDKIEHLSLTSDRIEDPDAFVSLEDLRRTPTWYEIKTDIDRLDHPEYIETTGLDVKDRIVQKYAMLRLLGEFETAASPAQGCQVFKTVLAELERHGSTPGQFMAMLEPDQKQSAQSSFRQGSVPYVKAELAEIYSHTVLYADDLPVVQGLVRAEPYERLNALFRPVTGIELLTVLEESGHDLTEAGLAELVMPDEIVKGLQWPEAGPA